MYQRRIICAFQRRVSQANGPSCKLLAMAAGDPAQDTRKELDWLLHINVPTQGVGKNVRVTSDESVGALMIKIAEKLGECRVARHAASFFWHLPTLVMYGPFC